MSKMMSRVVYENNQFLIAYKEHNMPTVPLKSQKLEGTLLGLISVCCPEVLSVKGKNPWEGGALHRLDTATAGLVLFAKEVLFYEHIIKVQNENLFEKTYTAICDNKSICSKSAIIDNYGFDGNRISSFFRAFGPGRKLVKAEYKASKSDSKRLYTTHVTRVSENVYECRLTKGFRHQIRVHLASVGCPIKGDKLYNPNPGSGDMQLICTGLKFPLPDGSIFTYSLQ